MYLVHAHFRAHVPLAVPSVQFAELVLAQVRASGGVEHASAHFPPPHALVIGFWLSAGTLREAETRTRNLCERALETVGELSGWTLLRAEAPLLAPTALGLLGLPESTEPGHDDESPQ
ncbi:hypothetical protein ACIQRE_09505 [Streptomyces griseoluteus]|uniref:hypothetical protein n=1 Tax=Streptomyces griseoluteus TaxID=29306 RepID=UPI0038258D0C